MYLQLLNADVVIADVSTYHPIAFCELGVRHALQSYSTITIAQAGVSVRCGPDRHPQIPASRRRNRFRRGGADANRTAGRHQDRGSARGVRQSGLHLSARSPPLAIAREEAVRAIVSAGTQTDSPSQPTIRMLMDRAEAALKAADFVIAKSLFAIVRSMMPMDNCVAQKLALATYKSQLPTAEAALNEAADILESLQPTAATDCETLGLYGAVHKRLWGATNAAAHLDRA